jgi:adenylate cyclase
MDGLTFLNRLNAQSSRSGTLVKTLVLSAYNDMDYIRRAMNEGAYDFVTKPINFLDLERTIARALLAVQELKSKQTLARE